MCKPFVSLVILSYLSAACIAQKPKDEPKPAHSVPELRNQLEKILKDSHIPGVSIAIVREEGAEWVDGIGLADVASGRPATADTLFRIGSTSKAFASLSILKLVREGKLSLDDPIRRLVPEVEFQNRWESSAPVRVVNLLEHTTGWDDMHLREYAKDAPGMDLYTALEYGKSSRVSRWPPGTRMSYCNTGPAVAAYIVEKITGQRFEDYVQQNLFDPIGMKTATYLEPPAGTATMLYHPDGKTPYPYWNIIYRPAGSINASANDMAQYVQFYVNRGLVNGTEIAPAKELDRMESPTTTWEARDGLKSGYGLSNYWSIQDGFVYHGHNGGVEGGLTELAYLPEEGVGYFFSINSGNGDGFGKVSKAIRNYVTLGRQRPAVPAPGALPLGAEAFAGWYVPNSPRQEVTRFLEQLLGLSLVHFKDGKMLISGMNGTQTFVPVSSEQFRYVPKDGLPEPVATVALLAPTGEGKFIHAGETLKKIPPSQGLAQVGLAGFVVLAIVSIVAYAPFWIIGGFFKRRRRPAERAMRIFPLLAVLSLVAFVGIFIICSSELITRMGNLTVWSAALCATTITFAAATVMALWSSLGADANEVRRTVRWYSVIVSLGLLTAMIYLAYWGIIGLRTWV